MRATTIPAQITTVEDKIAGNLNMTQVAILAIPIVATAMIYTAFPPTFHFALYKLPLILLIALFSIILSLRIKGKVVVNWLLVILRYNLRPRYYVFEKNDEYLREMCLPKFEKTRKLFKSKVTKSINISANALDIRDLAKLKDFIRNSNYNFSFKINEKGGVNVVFGQIKQ